MILIVRVAERQIRLLPGRELMIKEFERKSIFDEFALVGMSLFERNFFKNFYNFPRDIREPARAELESVYMLWKRVGERRQRLWLREAKV